MLRYVEMDNAAPLMGQNDHDKQSPEGCGRNGKEIGGSKVFEVIVEENFPRLEGILFSWASSETPFSRRRQSRVSAILRGFEVLPTVDWQLPSFGSIREC